MASLDDAVGEVLGSPASSKRPAADPLDAAVDQVLDTEKTQLRTTLFSAVRTRPDDAAEAAKLSRQQRLPEDVILRNLQDVQLQAAVDDADRRLQTSPKLRQAMLDPSFAKKAHDDLEGLGALEQAMRTIKNAPRAVAQAFPRGAAGFYGALSAPFEVAGQGFRVAEDILADLMGAPRGAAGPNAGEMIGGTLRSVQIAQGETAKEIGPETKGAGVIERGVYSGLTSATQTLATLPIALREGGQNAALAILGLIEGGSSYGEARDKGKNASEATAYGTANAVAEVVTERLPMAKLLGDIKAGTGAAKMLVNNLVREVPGELAATTWQSFNEWATLNPDKTVSQWVSELPAQLAETVVATLVGGAGQTGVIKGVQAISDRMGAQDTKAKQADQGAQRIADFVKLAEASKLRERDAPTFKAYVEQLAEDGDAPTDLYIDGATLANSLSQSGVTIEEFEAIAPVAARQLGNAALTGSDVRVPVSEFAIAGDAITAPLTDHLRVSEDAMSRAEAQEFIKAQGDAIRAQVESELQQRDDMARHRQSIEAVRTHFETELNNVKRFTPDVNKAYAELLANFYGTQAARVGMTPEEMLQKYQLRVSAKGIAGGQTLNQADKVRPQLRSLVEAAMAAGNENATVELGAVSDGEVEEARASGLDLTGYRHTVDMFAVRHALNQHGDAAMEASRGQIGLTADDFAAIPDVIDAPDARVYGAKTPRKQEVVASIKRLPDGSLLVVEEVRTGRKTLALVSVRKYPAARDFDSIAGTLLSNAQSDGGALRIVTPNNLDQSDRAALSFGDDITASPSVISLLAGADLSSFLHESGHFFLEVQADLAMRIGETEGSEAAQGIVKDMNTLLEWFGIKGGLDEWSRMSLDQKRESHEKFARGFEAFAFEGKAPSIALQGIFQRFRSWLVNVYKTLTKLDVTLTDDVRAVMVRMIASDLAIEEAEAQRNMGPLFKDAESAGMTPEEYAAYQGVALKATEAAVDALQTRSLKDMKWLSRARDKALKARQQEVDELRREVKNEVRAEVMAEPVYQAWQFLTGKQDQVAPGEQAAEDIDTVQQSGRLRTQVLREMYGTEEAAVWRTLSSRRMTSDTTGMHPEIVAEMFGYDSADAMVQALAAAVPPTEVVDARTDQRMLEMFGDISSQEALDRAADEAVHNEVRARFIASELKALQAANSVREKRGKGSIDVMARAARDYAEQIVARLKVRDIRPGQYAAAEARNAKQAEKAFAAGKTEEAAMHKRNQLINNYATRAAYEAQDEVKKASAYFRKFDKRSKGIDPAYQDQIEAMLERFEFRPASLKEIDRRKSLAAWVEQQRADGIEPSIAPELLNEANRKSYKDMTLEEIRGLRDAVKQIEHLGRLKNKLLLARDKRDFDAIAEEMAASIVKHGGKARPVKLEGEKGVIPWLQGVAASHRKLASLFRQMDGASDAGPLYQQIGRSMNERGTMEEVMIEQATVALRALYAPIMKLKGGTAGGKVFIKEIGASLSRGGRLAVALNWGNESNRQRVMSGDGWSEAQVNAILKTLTPTELEFVNGVWAYIDTYWEQIAAKEKRLTGVAPEKVDGLPFTVTAADGSQVQMRGGYYPLKYDSDRSDRAATQEAAQVAQEMMQGAFTRATTRRGHTKARLEEVSRPVRKDLNVITQHITQVVHDLAWHEWLIDTNRLLGDERIVNAIRDHYGPPVLKTIRDDVMGIATADVVPGTDIDKALLKLRSNVTRATMGASLTTAFLQPFGLTQSMVRIGPKHVLRGLARWGGDAAKMESSLGWIQEKSEFMRLRAKTFNRELREIRGSVEGKSKAMQAVDGGLFWLMRKMQAVADVPTWIGQYEKSLAEGLDDDAAVSMADRAVLESQGGGQTKDLAEVQRKHPMLTQFYSYFSVTLNLTAERTAATDFKNPRAVAGWLGDMALLQVIPAILPSFLMFLLKGGEEDDEKGWAKRIAEWQLGYLLGNIVGVRELSGVLSGFDYAGPPVGRIVSDVGKAGKQTLQGELDEPAVLAYARLMGDAFGIPTTQAIRSYKGWKAWDEGVAGPQAILFGPPPKE
jgi:hypothetical protein